MSTGGRTNVKCRPPAVEGTISFGLPESRRERADLDGRYFRRCRFSTNPEGKPGHCARALRDGHQRIGRSKPAEDERVPGAFAPGLGQPNDALTRASCCARCRAEGLDRGTKSEAMPITTDAKAS